MQKKISFKIFVFILIFFFSTVTKAEIIYGFSKVIDGDTILVNNKKIRFFGIDAPEKKQLCQKNYFDLGFFVLTKDYKCGEKSTLALSKKLKDKKVKCILEKNKDRYNRNIGTCYIKKQDINRWLVKNGYALAYKRYSKKYVLDEQYARENKLGRNFY